MAFQIVSELNSSYVLTLQDDNKVVAQPAALGAPGQVWEMLPYAEANSSDFPPGVVFYNTAFKKALAFGGNNQPLSASPFVPSQGVNRVDQSIIWSLSFDIDGGPCLKVMQPIEQKGQIWESRGGDISDGTIIETWNDNHGNNQKWRLSLI